MVKKLLSAVLALSMMTVSAGAFATVSAEATPITISAEVIRPGYTLASNYAATENTAYQWQVSESNDASAEWTNIEGATNADYTILNADGGKYLRLKVTEGSAERYSAAVQSGQPLGIVKEDYFLGQDTDGTYLLKNYVYNPPEYIATISGDTKSYQYTDTTQKSGTFSVLDVVENDKGEKEFFCLLAYQTATAAFSTDANNKWRFDPTDTSNIGYWMNTTKSGEGMLNNVKMVTTYSSGGELNSDEDGDGQPDSKTVGNISGLGLLKTKILPYVTEHTWLTEAGSEAMTDLQNDYTFKAKLTLLSASEALQYKDKFGYRLSGTYQRLRSPYMDYKGTGTSTVTTFPTKNLATAPTANTRYIGSGNWAGSAGVRPCFYLNEEFFKDIKLDLANTGDEVKKAIRENYTLTEMLSGKAGYTMEELGQIYSVSDESSAAAVTITEAVQNVPGYSLTAVSSDTSAEFLWQISEDGTEWTNIANEQIYTIVNDNAGKMIRVVAYTKSIDGAYAGTPAVSEAVTVGKALESGIENGDTPAGITADGDKSWIAVIDGSDTSFSVLDTEASGSATNYFCYANFATATAYWTSKEVTENNKYARFDPEDPTNIAYWMNDENGMLAMTPTKFGSEDSYVNRVDRDIVEYAIAHDWLTEKGYTNHLGTENDYLVNARFALLSEYELCTYASKIGYNKGGSGHVRLRTPNDKPNGLSWTKVFATGTGVVNSGRSDNDLIVRPAFYLDDSFFLNVKLDLAKTGDEVKNLMKTNYTFEELLGIYGKTELYDIYPEKRPAVAASIDVLTLTDGLLEIEYTSYNATGEAINADVITAIYSADGILLQTGIEKACGIAKDDVLSGNYLCVEEVPDGAAEIKLFFWDSVNGAKPVCESVFKEAE